MGVGVEIGVGTSVGTGEEVVGAGAASLGGGGTWPVAPGAAPRVDKPTTPTISSITPAATAANSRNRPLRGGIWTLLTADSQSARRFGGGIASRA